MIGNNKIIIQIAYTQGNVFTKRKQKTQIQRIHYIT